MKKPATSPLQSSLLSITRIHFAFVGLFVVTIVLSDAWNLIPPSVVLQRWTLASLLLASAAGIWYVARATKSQTLLQAYAWILAVVDLALATIIVFAQRGMASKAVFLYVVPLLVIAVLRSRVALVTTAIICLATYSLAVVRYFVTSPGEGYKAELYVELFFYGGLFFIIAALLYSLVSSKNGR